MKIVVGFLAAALLPALLLAAEFLRGQFVTFPADDPYIWVRSQKFLVMALFVSAAYVLILGVPAFLLLRKLRAIHWWSTIGVGFLLGAFPIAVISWPYRFAGMSASSNGVQTIINGTPTSAGWLEYVSALSFVGGCGALGAAAFWLVWRTHEPQPSLQADGPASGGPAA